MAEEPVAITELGQPPTLQNTRAVAFEARRVLVRELVRASLAITFVVILAVTLWSGFQKVGTAAWPETKDFLAMVLPAETALLGSAVAFFFATEPKK